MFNYGFPTFNTMPSATQPYGYPITPPQMPQNLQPALNSQQFGLGQIQTRNDGGIFTNIVYVNDENAAKTYNLPPNSNFALWDNDKGIIYHKVVDNTGKMNILPYDVIPHTETPVEQPDYALKSDILMLQKELAKLRMEVTKE